MPKLSRTTRVFISVVLVLMLWVASFFDYFNFLCSEGQEVGEQNYLPTLTLYIQPIGPVDVPKDALAEVISAIQRFYGLKIKISERRPLPDYAYYPERDRYRADQLLIYLSKIAPPDADYVLGITTVDISITLGDYEDIGVFGFGAVDDSYSIISYFRTNIRNYPAEKIKEIRRIRLAKVAVHELGHNLGLEHCSTQNCIMQYSRWSLKEFDLKYFLCDQVCRKKLRENDFILPPKKDSSYLKLDLVY